MFDYANKVQLALTDTARRTGIKVGAAVVLTIGAAFLLAALWSYLAHNLRLGPAMASLIIGGALVVISLIAFAIASRRRHHMPTTDDLKREVEERVSLAADAAVERARAEALRVVDMAGSRAQSLIDHAGARANQFASDAEQKVFGLARGAASSVGLGSDNLNAAKQGARDAVDGVKRAADSNPGSMAKLISAFAVGVALAAKVQDMRGRDRRRDYDPDDVM